jgi:hypothetical protein
MTKGEIIKKLISEKFASKAQQRFFYAMADKDTKKGRKFKKWAKEFSDDTDFEDIPEKVSEDKKETKNPKMKKRDLVEYINSKVKINESPYNESGDRFFVIREIPSSDRTKVFKFLEHLRESGLINMYGASPLLNWDKDDLHRWLYGMGKDPESLEEEIENLDYYDEDEDEYDSTGDKNMLEKQLTHINYLLDNKQEIRDILIRAALDRIENSGGSIELINVQRVFERMASDSFKMWTSIMYPI